LIAGVFVCLSQEAMPPPQEEATLTAGHLLRARVRLSPV
jgi:hypothetical protein